MAEEKLDGGMDSVISGLLAELRREEIPLTEEAVGNYYKVRDWLRDKVSSVFGPFHECRKSAPQHLKRSEAIQLLLYELNEEAEGIMKVFGRYLPYMTNAEQGNAIACRKALAKKWRAVRGWLNKKLREALKAEGKPVPEKEPQEDC